MNAKSLIKIIGAVAIINLAARLIGFLREVLIGFHFGTSMEADSVVAAYTIPNFLYLAAGGAIATAFISVYSKTEGRLQQSFRQLVFTYTFTFFFVVSLAFFLFPNFWIDLFFWGFDMKEKALTSDLFKLMGISTVFLSISMFFTGVLNAHDRFRASALGPLFNNLIFVGVAALCYSGAGIEAYAYAAVLGALFMFGVLFHSLRKEQLLTFRFTWSLSEKGYFKRFLFIALPILFGGATLQFYFLIHRIFASQLAEGAIAALNYSSKFVQLPQTILMTAVTTVIYPLIARTIAAGDREKLDDILNRGLSLLAFVMVPASIYVFFYAEELISLLFEYGQFNAESTVVTASLLQILVVGMLAHAGNVYLTRFFYAMERPASAIITGLIAVFGVNVLISALFIGRYGEEAIAWATTVSAYVQMILLLVLLTKRLDLRVRDYWKYGKQGLFFLVLISIMLVSKYLLDWLAMGNLLQLLLSGIVFICAFTLLAFLFKIPELNTIGKMIRK
ncbi:murein biosynthesis integral membrane protein MurJ [Bacillus sp. AK031]